MRSEPAGAEDSGMNAPLSFGPSMLEHYSARPRPDARRRAELARLLVPVGVWQIDLRSGHWWLCPIAQELLALEVGDADAKRQVMDRLDEVSGPWLVRTVTAQIGRAQRIDCSVRLRSAAPFVPRRIRLRSDLEHLALWPVTAITGVLFEVGDQGPCAPGCANP
jgi:hypothetical protein